jgi:transcriptional regulator with XRE-family HTH domain
MDIKSQLGQKIKRLRQKRGLTQEKFAKMINISLRTLSGIETGENFMTAQTLENILTCLNITPDELFNSDHIKPTSELLEEIERSITSVQNDREKIENIYKIIKAIVTE